jgi:cytochrome P450
MLLEILGLFPSDFFDRSKARGDRQGRKLGLGLTNRSKSVPKPQNMASILQIKPITGVPSHLRASAQPQDPAFYQNPYPFYARQNMSHPAFFWEEYGHWCFADFKSVSALLRDKRFGRDILHVASREEIGLPAPKPHVADFDLTEKYSLLNLEAKAHTRLRTLVNRAFVSRQVEQLRPRIKQLAHELIDGFEENDSVDLIKEFAAPIPAIVIAEMIGLPAEMAPQLLNWSNRMVTMYMYNVTRETELDANQAAADFMAYLREVIAERRKAPREDLLTHMLTTDRDGDVLNDEEVMSTAILLLNAGHEATVHTTGNGVKSILESGLDPRTLFATPEQAESTVEECLRFDAPLHLFTRYTLEDTELAGIALRKGDVVGLMLGAANRDPNRFANADSFDPFRTDGANVSFGAGIHFCIGAPLARIELQESMKVLFERLPKLRIAEPPRYGNVYHFHGLERLLASWK